MLKKVILILVTAGFVWSFYASTNKAFAAKSAESAKTVESEKEDSKNETDDFKFLGQNEEDLFHLKIENHIITQNILNYSSHHAEVPTSPPNA